MATGGILDVQPSELKFPFELKKQSSCTVQLTNKTDQYVAFKVKTTNPKKYFVRPNNGIVLPGSSSNITVTMQAQREAPPDMECKDKFLIQSVIAPQGASSKDITTKMFNSQDNPAISEFRLRVVYVPANHPSPVPEESEEEGSSPRASLMENEHQNSSLSNAAMSAISKLTEEKASIIQQNQRLCRELETMRKEINRSRARDFSVLFLVLVGILGVVAGYLVK